MNKKSIFALIALILLAIVLLLGLPLTTDRIIADSMKQTVMVTATPPPVFDNLDQ